MDTCNNFKGLYLVLYFEECQIGRIVRVETLERISNLLALTDELLDFHDCKMEPSRLYYGRTRIVNLLYTRSMSM